MSHCPCFSVPPGCCPNQFLDNVYNFIAFGKVLEDFEGGNKACGFHSILNKPIG